MKVYCFAILAGGLVVLARAQEEELECNEEYMNESLPADCENLLDCIACDDYLNREIGCQDPEARINCRRHCNLCNSFEQLTPRDDVAVLYGGNHVLTFDRLPFECTGRGEFVLYLNSRIGMKVHALLTRPEGVRNSVPTAVAAIDSDRKPKLQIAVNLSSTRRVDEASGCPLIFWVGGERVFQSDIRSLGGYGGIAKEGRNEYKIELPSGARVGITVAYREEQGCYFEKVRVMILKKLKEGTKGLLGTPDNNIYNDWNGRHANSSFPLPPRYGRYLGLAYNYVRKNWCIRNFNRSIITYKHLGGFPENIGCNEDYDGFTDFSSATGEMRRVCGASNYECLHESISSRSARQGMNTIRLMEDAEYGTVPENKDGLDVQPRGIPADEPWTVTVIARFHQIVNGLNGFGLYELNEANLIRTEKVIGFLSDDGDYSKGDAKRLDRLFTDQLELKLGNGISTGFVAVPMINGTYALNRKDLFLTLPNAVRGYSDASDRSEANTDEQKRRIMIDKSAIRPGTDVYVSFRGPSGKKPPIVGARFLEEYVGDRACGSQYREQDHLECVKCEDAAFGHSPNVTFHFGQALKGKVSASTELRLDGFFVGSLENLDDPEPVELDIVVNVKGSSQALKMPVFAKQILIQDPASSYCTKEHDETLLGAVRFVINQNTQRWEISLSESHIM